MISFALRRLLSMLLTLLAASVVIFAALEVVPGDPAVTMLGINASEETLAALRAELGLGGDPVTRYFTWITGMATGDFGISYTYRTPVSELLWDRLWVSFPLAFYALGISIAAGIPMGFAAARYRRTPVDVGLMGVAGFGVAVPNFWFGMILVVIFAINLGWFSAGGFPGWDAGVWAATKALTLPAIALGLPLGAILARVMRSSLIETMDEDFTRTARAKGLSRSQTLWRHAFRNALIPVVTLIGLQFSFLLAGVVFTENVFFLPGLGRLILQAIQQRDIIVVESVVMVLVFAVILVTFVVDLLYAAVDPRLRGAR